MREAKDRVPWGAVGLVLGIIVLLFATSLLIFPFWITSDNALAVFVRNLHTQIFQAVLAVLKGEAR